MQERTDWKVEINLTTDRRATRVFPDQGSSSRGCRRPATPLGPEAAPPISRGQTAGQPFARWSQPPGRRSQPRPQSREQTEGGVPLAARHQAGRPSAVGRACHSEPRLLPQDHSRPKPSSAASRPQPVRASTRILSIRRCLGFDHQYPSTVIDRKAIKLIAERFPSGLCTDYMALLVRDGPIQGELDTVGSQEVDGSLDGGESITHEPGLRAMSETDDAFAIDQREALWPSHKRRLQSALSAHESLASQSHVGHGPDVGGPVALRRAIEVGEDLRPFRPGVEDGRILRTISFLFGPRARTPREGSQAA